MEAVNSQTLLFNTEAMPLPPNFKKLKYDSQSIILNNNKFS